MISETKSFLDQLGELVDMKANHNKVYLDGKLKILHEAIDFKLRQIQSRTKFRLKCIAKTQSK